MPCPPHYPARSAIWALHWSASCWATSPAEFWACSGAWTPGEEPFGSSAQAYRKTRRCAGGVVHRGSSGIQPIAHPRRRPGRTGTSVGRTGLEVSIGRDCAPRVGSEPVPNSVEPVPPDAGVILLWQTCWTAGAAALASWLQAQGVSDALMTACSLLILCSAPAIAGVRRAALANLLPALVWIPALAFWLRGG